MSKNSLIKKNQLLNRKTFFEVIKEPEILISILLTLLLANQMKAQEVNLNGKLDKMVTLETVINKASKNSLEAFKAKRQYGVSFYEFKSFKASLLPKIGLELEPLSYNRSVEKRYDSENNIDVYRPQQNLNSYANIAITQNIRATGTNVYVSSNFNSLTNYGDDVIKNYSVTPIRIGIFQPIMAFNRFKWEKKTAPLKYNISKQNFIYELENINIKSVDLFFNWALASKKVDIAKESDLAAQRLFNIGKKRYELGSIEKDDLLNLELDVYNANINLIEVEKELSEAVVSLNLFLRDESMTKVKPELPTLVSSLQINIDEAFAFAIANNPVNLNLKLKKIEALQDLDRIVKQNRFDLSLSASYGLNQNANTIHEAYASFLDQQIVSVHLNVPILDWGERKGNIKTAKMNKEVQDIELQEEEEELKQRVALKVADFNHQEQLVIGALRTSEISRESYEISEKRFLSGTIDLLRFSSAKKAWQSSSEDYIRSLMNYWKYYYEVQQLTLFDFINKKEIKKDIDSEIDN